MVNTHNNNNFFFSLPSLTFPKNSLNGTNCTMSRRAGSPQVERIGVSSASKTCIFNVSVFRRQSEVVSPSNLGKVRISNTDNHNRNGHVIFANNLIDAGLQIIQHPVSQQHQNLISLSVLFKKNNPLFSKPKPVGKMSNKPECSEVLPCQMRASKLGRKLWGRTKLLSAEQSCRRSKFRPNPEETTVKKITIFSKFKNHLHFRILFVKVERKAMRYASRRRKLRTESKHWKVLIVVVGSQNVSH
jgi:hypothetical protein